MGIMENIYDNRVQIKTMIELIQKAKHHNAESEELDCDITLSVNGEYRKAYSVSVSYRDLLFYTDQGTVTYLIDSYTYGDYAVLHDYERDWPISVSYGSSLSSYFLMLQRGITL